jgi:uncharacterized membrane protein
MMLGAGLGGFVDGILLHQILQWHHLLTSAGFPPDTVDNFRVNTLADGLFHAGTWAFTAIGLLLLWQALGRRKVPWSSSTLLGGLLLGWGTFNLVEGIIDHQILGIHHVNETAPPAQWIYWDLGFLAFGLLLVLLGSFFVNAGQQDAERVAAQRRPSAVPERTGY